MQGFPFTLFKRKNSPFYYVRFKNERTGKYFTKQYSTKKTIKAEALKVAMTWLVNGIENKASIDALSAIDLCNNTIKNTEELKLLLDVFLKKGMIYSVVLPETAEAISFCQYLSDFWTWEKSSYVKEKLKKEHGIHKDYVYIRALIVKRYWLPFFDGMMMGEITKKDLERFIDNVVSPLKLSHASKNNIINAGLLCLRHAFKKEIIRYDITAGIELFSGKHKKRMILTAEIAKVLFLTHWKDKRAYLANVLASITGLREGEIQALRRQDIGDGCLYIRHNWTRKEHLKPPKNNEQRTVLVPHSILRALGELLDESPHPYSLDNFIFCSVQRDGYPVHRTVFIDGLHKALQSIGMSEEESKRYKFHSWRHFYAARMKNKIDDKLLQSQTGHKSIKMLEHYADHELEDDKQRIRDAQKEVFSDLIPHF